jgi:hypothetical protein
MEADEFINAHNESGSQLMIWFREHAASSKHRGGYAKRGGHFDTHMGRMSNGGCTRFRVRSVVAAIPVQLRHCFLPRSGLQGGTYPSKESAIRATGQLQDLVSASLFHLANRQVEVNIIVDDNGKRRRTRQTLRLSEVKKVSLAMVIRTQKQMEQQYRLSGSGISITWEDMFNNDREWWIMVLQMEPFIGGETMPQAMMECLIHERGIPCGIDRKERVFQSPLGYVLFAQ